MISTVAFAEKSYQIWTTFSSGELSPLLDGQVNFDKYFTGVKKLENFLARPQGPVSNRPGFKFIAETETSTQKSRLVPFIFSDTQAYVLEFGDQYIRFFRDGGQITSLDAPTVLLLSMNGNDASTTFTDSSATPHSMTANGNAQIDTSTKKFGSGSGLFDGTGDSISTPDSVDFNLSASDGGIDTWVRPTVGNSGIYTIFRQDQDADSEVFMRAYLDKYTGLLLNGNGTDESTTIADSSLNTKTLTRDGNTSLLLHGNGTDGSTNIVDVSSTVHTISRNGTVGGPVIDTAQSVFGGASILFDKSDNQFLSVPRHTDFDFSGGTFTIKTRFRLNSLTTQAIFDHRTNSTNFHFFRVHSSGALQYAFTTAGAGSILTSGAGSIVVNTWYDIEISRDNSTNTYRMFINGTLVDSEVNAVVQGYFTGDIYIGNHDGGTSYFDGWIDDLHMFKGIVSHTANFTSATVPHVAIEIDTSDPKFGTGAIKFGGQDYLTENGDSDFDIGATGSAEVFTIEMRVNPDVVSGTPYLFQHWQDTNNYLEIYHDGVTVNVNHKADGGTVVNIAGGTLVAGTYSHIAVVGDGTNLTLYVDGENVNTDTFNDNLDDMSTDDIFIGAFVDGGSPFKGLIDDFKFSLNARYSGASLTVPTVEDKDIVHAVWEIGETTPTTQKAEAVDDNITAESSHHVEFNWDTSANKLYLFTDGQLRNGGAVTFTGSTADPSGSLDSVFSIGSDPDGTTLPFKGWMDELRFTKGSLRHTASFVPPVVEYTLLGATPLELTTNVDYVEADLFELQFVQSADVLYIAHPDYPSRKLLRITDTTWRLVDIEFLPPPLIPDTIDASLALTLGQKTVGVGVAATDGTTAGTMFATGDIGKEIREDSSVGNGRAVIVAVADSDTATVDIFVEFSSTTVASGTWDFIGSNQSGTLTISGHYAGGTAVNYGEVVTLTASLDVFVAGDVGKFLVTDDGTIVIPYKILTYTSATVVTGVALSSGSYDEVNVIDVVDGDITLSKTANPDTIVKSGEDWSTFGSGFVAGAIINISSSTGGNDGEYTIASVSTVTITLANDVLNADEAAGSGLKVSVVTLEKGEWELKKSVWTTDDYPSAITFFENRLLVASSPSFPQTIWGSAVDDYENHNLGSAGDADAYAFTLAGRQVNKINWLDSSDVLLIGTIGAEWVLGTKGSSAPTTPSNVLARLQTGFGSEAIQSVNIGQSVLYLQKGGEKVREMVFDFDTDKHSSPDLSILAEHITNGGIVEMDYQDSPISTGWFVRGDGVLLSMTLLREQNVIGWARHITDGTFESIAVIPGDNADELWVIVNRTIESATKRYVERMNPIFDDTTLDSNQAFFVDSGLQYDGVSTSTITGLDHLDGETVSILGDGVVQADKTVSSGSITLDTAASKVSVGLPYTSTLQTMRVENKDNLGTSQSRKKRFNRVVFRVEKTKQFQYGQTPTGTLKTYTFDSLFSGDQEVDFVLGHTREGYVSIINSEPLPITIIAVIAEQNLSD